MSLALIYTGLRVCIHVIKGACTLFIVFPMINANRRQFLTQQWCSKLLNLFKLRLVVRGESNLGTGGYLLAANHISWIDIHVINAYKPHYFIAKSEVAQWPIFGWMARQLGTLFIERGSVPSLQKTIVTVAEMLKHHAVCIFPEGTSTDGIKILPFKSNIFEAALIAQAPIYPVVLQYFSIQTGEKTTAPAFIDEMGILDSIWMLLRCPGVYAELTFMPALLPTRDRKTLSKESQELILSQLRTNY